MRIEAELNINCRRKPNGFDRLVCKVVGHRFDLTPVTRLPGIHYPRACSRCSYQEPGARMNNHTAADASEATRAKVVAAVKRAIDEGRPYQRADGSLDLEALGLIERPK